MISSGDIVGGRYVVERLLGEGGMATVWLARDRTLVREVAIKFMWQRDPRHRKERVNGFLREARLAASVVHRNVVQIMDFGLHDDETPYMVMEALTGKTLGEHFDEGAQFSLREVLQLGLRSLEGLIAVHDVGIVHRDLKPENIFLMDERTGHFPKLLDFGISRSLDPSGERRSAVTTMDGRVVGTPEYMSPEQANGSADITRQTDVYAMGVILYETITGDVPYRSEHLGDLLMQITLGAAPTVTELVPEIGQSLSDVISKAMQLRPPDRYADASEMYDAWARAADATYRLAGEPTSILPDRAPGRRERAGRVSCLTDSMEADLDSLNLVQPHSPLPTMDAGLASGGTQSGQPGVVVARGLPRWLWPVVAAMVALAGLIAFGAARVSTSPPQTPRYIVVQGTNEQSASGASPVQASAAGAALQPSHGPVARDQSGGPVNAPAPGESAAMGIANTRKPKAAVPLSQPAPKAPKKAKKTKKADPEESVARAFSRQKSGVVRCLEQHPDIRLPQLSVRMRVDVRGRVQNAAVLPGAVAQTSVGTCIEQAVARMRFMAQREAATYRVPLVARRGP